MHLSSSGNNEFICGVTVTNTKRNIFEKFSVKSLAKLTGCNELTFLTCKRACIYSKSHLNGRLTNLNELKRLGICCSGKSVTDRNVTRTREANNITHFCVLNGNTKKTVYLIKRHDLCSSRLFVGLVEVANKNLLSDLHTTALYSAYSDTSNVIVVVNGRYKHLKISIKVALGSRHIIKNSLKEGSKIASLLVRRVGCSTRTTRAVKHGGVDLIVVSTEVYKKLKDLVLNLDKTGIGLVDLVYTYDDLVVKLKCALKNESCLRHRTFSCINKKDNSVYHLENTLDLTAEIRVSGSIDNVDLNVLIVYRRVLCENGNTPFLLDIIRVHYASNGLLIFSVYTTLLEQSVNKRCFAVFNVRDYCNVS